MHFERYHGSEERQTPFPWLYCVLSYGSTHHFRALQVHGYVLSSVSKQSVLEQNSILPLPACGQHLFSNAKGSVAQNFLDISLESRLQGFWLTDYNQLPTAPPFDLVHLLGWLTEPRGTHLLAYCKGTKKDLDGDTHGRALWQGLGCSWDVDQFPLAFLSLCRFQLPRSSPNPSPGILWRFQCLDMTEAWATVCLVTRQKGLI